MMCPIVNYINKLRTENIFSQLNRENIMRECKLKYRNGKNDSDILKILKKKRQPCIVHGLMPWVFIEWYGVPKTLSDIYEEMAEEIDSVIRIDWAAYYGKVIPSITFV